METLVKSTIYFGEFALDPLRRVLKKDGETVHLNSKALDLLLVLIENRGEIVEKNELLDKVWANQFVEENNLTVHVAALRKALGDTKGNHRCIITVPGRGYSFVAEVRQKEIQKTPVEDSSPVMNGNDDEIIVETHKFKRFVIEEEIENDSTENIEIRPVRQINTPQYEKQNSFKFSPALVYSAIGIGLLAIAFVYWFSGGEKKYADKQAKSIKLTNSGKVTNVAFTPDGKYAVFAQTETSGESLRLRHISTGSQNQILKPQSVNFVGLTVTPDSNFIYATVFSGDFSDPQLWRIPLLGGVTEHIQGVITGAAVSFSPNGEQMVFTVSRTGLKETHLIIADANGANGRILLRASDENRSFPNFKANPVAWSPDGNEIACAVEENSADGARKTAILLINPSNASERYITENRWDYAENLAWIDAENLALTGSSNSQNQIWKISRKTGEARQITDNLSDYSWISGANGNLLTVQKTAVSKISIGVFDADGKNLEMRSVLEESGIISNVNWSADGKILYSSNTAGKKEIRRVETDGADNTQLTVNSNVSFGLAVSPVDGSLLFCSTENGKSSLYLTNSEGKNMRRLTDGTEDVWANFTPDGRTIIFQRGLNSKMITLWRLDLGNGKLTQLTETHATHPAISPDGTRTAYYFMDRATDNLWRIGLISNATGEFLGKINLPKEATERRLQWHPNGRFLSQIAYHGDEIKLLQLPIDNSESPESFGLGKGDLQWFEWSKDGKKIVVSQTTQTQDVVLLD